MENKVVKCGKLNISNSSPFTLIAGPCQLESEKHALDVAKQLKEITESFDETNLILIRKGNRLSVMPIISKIAIELLEEIYKV